MGVIDARNGPLPANIEALFPDPFNADTWNLAAISPLVRTYDIGVGDFFTDDVRPQFGVVAAGRLADRVEPDAEPRRPLRPEPERERQRLRGAAVRRSRATRTTPTTSQPRLGFAYRLTDRTVAPRRHRGSTSPCRCRSRPTGWRTTVQNSVIQITNDGRAELRRRPAQRTAAADARAGAASGSVTCSNVPGCLRETVQELVGARRTRRTWRARGRPRSASQRQIGSTMVGRGGLRLQQGPPREGHHRQRQPDVQPGDRRELSVLRHQPPRVSRSSG